MDLARFDLNLLRVFEAVHVHRNASLAAESLGLTQPAVSNALRRLRRELGDELFIRTPAGMEPTPRAERLAAGVSQALALLREGVETTGDFVPAAARRRFTLLMSDIGEVVFLPRLIAFLEREAPGVTCRTVTAPARAARLALESGAVDLAVGFLPEFKTGFYQQRLFSQSYVCLVRRDHPQFGGQLTAKGFRGARHAIVDAEGTGHGIVETVFERAGLEPEVRMRLPHFLAAPFLVAETDLVVTVPQRLGEIFARVLPLKLYAHPLAIPSFQVNQYWHRRYHKDPANQWLRSNFARLFGA